MSGSESDQALVKHKTSLVDVFISSWTSPARTAKRLNDLALTQAFAVHVVSALTAFAVIIVLGAIADIRSATISGAILKILGEFAEEWARRPLEVSLFVIAIAVGIELAFVNFALAVTPWGARDERLRESYKHTVRQTWLRTPQLVVMIAIMGSTIVGVGIARKAWSPPPMPIATYPVPPQASARSEDQDAYNKALAQYQADLAAASAEQARLQAEWQATPRFSRPWYVTEPEIIYLPMGTLLVLWFFWTLLRAVGIKRSVPPVDRPPLCEACGYNLTTMPMDARCPECGRSVIESLGPNVRAGTAWAHRKAIGGRGVWLSTALTAIRHPSRLGAQLRVTSHETAHRWFMVRVLPLVFLIGATALFAFDFLMDDGAGSMHFEPVFLVVCGLFGSACVLGNLGFALNTALIVGLILTWQKKRNMLPAAMQAAAYLTGYLVAWSAFGAILSLVVEKLDRMHVFAALGDMTGIFHGALAALSWIIPNIACAIVYLILVARATAAARYANR